MTHKYAVISTDGTLKSGEFATTGLVNADTAVEAAKKAMPWPDLRPFVIVVDLDRGYTHVFKHTPATERVVYEPERLERV